MRKFYITSEKFTGSVEVMYNDAGCLVLLDCRGTNLEPAGIARLMRDILPAHISLLEERFAQNKALLIVETDFSVTLDDFKRAYPYRRNSHLLPPIWEKMNTANQVRAWKSAQEYRKYCERNNWYKPKIAAAWLKDGEYFNDWKTL